MKHLFFLPFLFFAFFVFPSSAWAQTATLLFSPATQTVQQGGLFTVTVMVNSGAEQVNAAAVYFDYPQDLLEAVRLDTAGSILGIFAPDNAFGGGKIKFSGGKIPPPFSGVQKLFSVVFRAKSLGAAHLAFTSDSAVLTQAENRNILSLSGSGSASFHIVAAAPVTPPTPITPPTPVPAPFTPPPTPDGFTISDIRAEKLSADSVRVSWTTSEEARGQVNWGPRAQENYEFSVHDGTLTREHSFILNNVRESEDYSLEIISYNTAGNEVREEQLVLADLFQEQVPPPAAPDESPATPAEFEIGGFQIRSPLLVVFVGLPLFVILLVAFLVFQRMRSRVEG